MLRCLARTRPVARALILAFAGSLSFAAAPLIAQAHVRAYVVIRPTPLVASGLVRFAARAGGPGVRKVVFSIDRRRNWTARARPFRYHGGGLLNTRSLSNGTHTLTARAFYAHGRVRTAHRQMIVRNQSIRASAPKATATATATSASTAVNALFNRETYNYSTLLSTSQEANRYSVMVLQSTNGSMVASLHAANPGLKIFVYQHPWYSRASDPGALGVCTSYQSDVANHPDWFLRNQSGGLIQAPGGMGNYLMDLGNPSYQQACVANAIMLAKKYGFDGVFLDEVAASVRWELPAGASAPKYPTDAAWQAAMYSMISYASSTLHANGLKVVGNLSGTTITSGLWQRWSTPLDGSEEESWTDGGQGLAQQIPYWTKKLANVAWSEANGKYTVLHSYNTTESANTYGLASMLLVAGTHTSYSTSNANYTSSEAWYPGYSTAKSLGSATGGYTKLANGVYERVFANGLVLVNPTSSTVPAFSLGGGTYSGSGLSAVRSASMGPTTGLVLLRTG